MTTNRCRALTARVPASVEPLRVLVLPDLLPVALCSSDRSEHSRLQVLITTLDVQAFAHSIKVSSSSTDSRVFWKQRLCLDLPLEFDVAVISYPETSVMHVRTLRLCFSCVIGVFVTVVIKQFPCHRRRSHFAACCN